MDFKPMNPLIVMRNLPTEVIQTKPDQTRPNAGSTDTTFVSHFLFTKLSIAAKQVTLLHV